MQPVLLAPVAHGLAHRAAQHFHGFECGAHRLRPKRFHEGDDLHEPTGIDDHVLHARAGNEGACIIVFHGSCSLQTPTAYALTDRSILPTVNHHPEEPAISSLSEWGTTMRR